MRMKKGQEEIFIVAALLIPAIVFGLVMTILYVNFAPVFEAEKIMAVFAHDLGLLVESAYSMPDDVTFRYQGPIDCKNKESFLNCSIGGYDIHVEKPVVSYVSVAAKANRDSPKISCEKTPFYGVIKFDWRFKDVKSVTAKQCNPATWVFAADYQDMAMLNRELTLSFDEYNLDSVEIKKKRTEFYDTIEETTVANYRNTNVKDMVATALKACRDQQDQTLEIYYLPNYKPEVYGSIFCIQYINYHPIDDQSTTEMEVGTNAGVRNVSCFNFNSETNGGEIPDIIDCTFVLDNDVNFENEGTGYDGVNYDSNEEKDYIMLDEEVWHMQDDSNRQTISDNQGDIRLDLHIGDVKRVKYLADSGELTRAVRLSDADSGGRKCGKLNFPLVKQVSQFSTSIIQNIIFTYEEVDETKTITIDTDPDTEERFEFSETAERMAVRQAHDDLLFGNDCDNPDWHSIDTTCCFTEAEGTLELYEDVSGLIRMEGAR